MVNFIWNRKKIASGTYLDCNLLKLLLQGVKNDFSSLKIYCRSYFAVVCLSFYIQCSGLS